ncbi:pyrimidine 5'-nucleotidase [Sphingopyxis sp. XHP0097]|uniref:Pyrimidine 5'-nucleotidase n=1 Tax=Sphingopyxis jiangsuensis TaxID=2871171 RepID=A0ABS7MED2_9SPHN|nr:MULTISPECIES: pyrimidine 5'-nucleotidase [Sphingopyxis]MBL0769505.1 pyrimidine 5'-nucleotidase [Sphingopyxis lutea]MBY4637387.1 pyrimidine 5'-nucleotidase [Sphingopyxis jiangsuensis]
MTASLAHIDCWIFDLDNTLYSPSARLFDLIDERMGAFIMRLLDVDAAAARAVQKQYFHDHGTTMAGLMRHHGVDPEDFLVDVHAIALDRIAPDARLHTGLARLPGRRLVFTNADADYAARVLEARGIADLFDGICDIRVTRYTPKPDPAAYAAMVDHLGIDPARSLFVEDMARNLTPAKALGMTTVWLDNGSESGHRDHLPEHVDFHVNDITDWLETLPQHWGNR